MYGCISFDLLIWVKLIICQQPNQSLKKKKQRNSPSKNSSEFSSFTRVRRETKFAVEMCAFVRLFSPSHVMPSQCRNFVLHSQTNPDYVHNVRTIFSLQKRKEHKTKNTQIVLKNKKTWPWAGHLRAPCGPSGVLLRASSSWSSLTCTSRWATKRKADYRNNI